MNSEIWLTPVEYARQQGRHVHTVLKWISKGWLPHEKIMRGQRPRYFIRQGTPAPRRHPGPVGFEEMTTEEQRREIASRQALIQAEYKKLYEEHAAGHMN